NVIEESELSRAPLFLGEEPGILHGNRNLARRGLHDFQIALLEDEFAIGAHGHHDAGRFACQEDRSTTETLCRLPRHERDTQLFPGPLQVGANQERLACAEHVLRQAISGFAGTLRQHLSALQFQLEADFVALLKGDIKSAGLEQLPELFLDGPQDLLLVEPGADGLPDFGQQLVFLCAPLGIVHDYIVFERESQLQRQSDQQPQVRGAKYLALSVREQNDAEVMLTGLQTNGGELANRFFFQDVLKLLEPSSGQGGKRLAQLCQIAKRKEPASPVSQFGNVFPRTLGLQLFEQLRGKPALYGRQHALPALGDVDDCAACWQRCY